MNRKEKFELYWIVIVIGTTAPLVPTVGGNPTSVQAGSVIPLIAVSDDKVIQGILYAHQYYFAIGERRRYKFQRVRQFVLL